MLRMGAVYFKLGQPDVGVAIIQQMVREYPDQVELVKEARKFLGVSHTSLKLTPPPWPDQEILTYIEGSRETGGLMFIAVNTGKKETRILIDRHEGLYPSRAYMTTSTKDFRPIRESYTSKDFTNASITFEDGAIHMETEKGEHVVKNDLQFFSETQFFYLVRRLPLTVGAQFSFPFFSEAMGMMFDLDLTVEGKERLRVAAGEFDCFKISTSIQFNLWVADTPERYVVKGQMMTLVSELAEISGANYSEVRALDHDRPLFHLPIPPEWFAYCRSQGEKEAVFSIMGPEYSTIIGLKVEEVETDEDHFSSKVEIKDGNAFYHIEVKRMGILASFEITTPEARFNQQRPTFDKLAKGLSVHKGN